MHPAIRYALLATQVAFAAIVLGLTASPTARHLMDTDDMGGGVGIRMFIYVLAGVTFVLIGILLASQAAAPRGWSSSLVAELTVMLVVGSSWLSAGILLCIWEWLYFWDVGGQCPGAPYADPERGGCRSVLRAAIAFAFLNGVAGWVLGGLDIHLGRMSVLRTKSTAIWVKPAAEAWSAEKEKEWLKMAHNNQA